MNGRYGYVDGYVDGQLVRTRLLRHHPRFRLLHHVGSVGLDHQIFGPQLLIGGISAGLPKERGACGLGRAFVHQPCVPQIGESKDLQEYSIGK